MDPGGSDGTDPALPRVTIVVLNYNYGRYAIRCLDSVKAQTYPNLHLVVLDDGSTDGSREIIRAWLDEHWPDATTDLSTENRGLTTRCNQGLALAEGEYYQIFSTDDQMVPDKISRQVAVMEEHPEAALCYGDMWMVDGDGEPLGWMVLDLARERGYPPRSGWVLDAALLRVTFATPSWLVRTRCAQEIGGYETRINTEDLPFLARMAARYPFEFLDAPLVWYRWHGDNTSLNFTTTPAHRLAWCEVLESIEVPEYARAAWITAYRRRVRILMTGNPRRDCVPRTWRLLRVDPSPTNLALWIAAELGICDDRLRWLIDARKRLRAKIRR